MGDSGSCLPFKCRNCGSAISLSTTYSSRPWIRSVKRKFDEFDDGNNNFFIPGFNFLPIARVEIENECIVLREAVSSQQRCIQDLYAELEQERNASSTAANEAMSMILRLQREKAEIEMEARQFKRFAEEKMAHDQEEIEAYEDLLFRREQVIQALTYEVQAYKHRMMSYGLTETEADLEIANLTMLEDSQFEQSEFEYPPIRCDSFSRHHGTTGDLDKIVSHVEETAVRESPNPQERLKNLELRISQMELSPRKIYMDGESPSARSVYDKVVVGVSSSPRGTMHSRRFSFDALSSLSPMPREIGLDCPTESPRLCSSFRKMHYIPEIDDNASRKEFEAAGSEWGGDDIRVYTVDAVHNGMTDNKPVGDDYVMNAPKESLYHADFEDPEIKKLYLRLQALEADRESMRQTIISMRTDKAQLVLLKEIAQQLCKEMAPERRVSERKTSFLGKFSIVAIFKWIISLFFWRNKARRRKYMSEMSANTLGLLLVLQQDPLLKPWRCLTRAQM